MQCTTRVILATSACISSFILWYNNIGSSAVAHPAKAQNTKRVVSRLIILFYI